jgi:hypothetical protein
MNKNNERGSSLWERQERIIWVEGLNTNNFNVDITGQVPQDAKNLKVKLSMCYIVANTTYNYTAKFIRILGDFGVGHNQFSSYNNYIQIGTINNPNINDYFNNCFELMQPNTMPKYSLYSTPTLINFSITNELYVGLGTTTGNTPPARVTLCLTFSYEI